MLTYARNRILTKAARTLLAWTGRTPDATLPLTAIRGGGGTAISSLTDTQLHELTAAPPLQTTPAALLNTARTSEIVNACLRVRADGLIAPVPVVERREADGSYTAIPDHPLIMLLRAPGPTLDPSTLWRTMSVSWDATGVVYLEPLYENGLLVGLNPLNPAAITEYPDRIEYDDGYVRVRFGRDELITRRTILWADPPPLYVALGAVAADQSMNEYIRAFFAFGGVPSGIIKVKGKLITGQAAGIRARWIRRFGGAATAQALGLSADADEDPFMGGPAVLDETVDYQRVGAQLDELQSKDLRGIAESRVTMAFGVPGLIIYSFTSGEQATYNNLGEAWASFWDSTMEPLVIEWQEWVNRVLLSQFETIADVLLGNVRFRFELKDVAAYQDDIAQQLKELRDAVKDGLATRNEYRDRARLPRDEAGGDVYLVPQNVATVPVGDVPATMPRLVPTSQGAET